MLVLRLGSHDIALPGHEVLIGRSVDCEIVVDDPLASRRHARVRVVEGQAVLEDLGSSNGVVVNGTRITAQVTLAPGDVIVVGQTPLVLVAASDEAWPPEAQTVEDAYAHTHLADAVEDEEPDTQRGDVLNLLGDIADAAIARGLGDEAERLMAPQLEGHLLDARARKVLPPGMPEALADHALRLAKATGKTRWIDYVLDLYRALGQEPPARVQVQLRTLRRLRARASCRWITRIWAPRVENPGQQNRSRTRLKARLGGGLVIGVDLPSFGAVGSCDGES